MTRPIKIQALLVLLMMISPLFAPLIQQGTARVTPSTRLGVLSPTLADRIAEERDDTPIPIIVRFPDGTDPTTMLSIIETYGRGLTVRHVFHLVPYVSAYAPARAIHALASSGLVTQVGLDKRVSALETAPEPVFEAESNVTYLHPTEALDVRPLWEQGYNGSGITVAVLDSGAWGGHPDLQGRIIGFKDLVNGLDDMNPSDGIDAYDDNGHGTATAWLVGGTDNGTGIYSGIAPGADLLIIKILDEDGTTDLSTMAQGIETAVDLGADIISLSVGGQWEDTGEDVAVESCESAVDAGVTVVVAAGNSGPAAETIATPGVATRVITVGASIGDGGVIAFSSRGPVVRTQSAPLGRIVKPDIVAPGYEVFSGRWPNASVAEYPAYNSTQYGGLYTRWSGTSAATPQIAGVAALLKQKFLTLNPLTTKAAIMAGANDLRQDPMAQGAGLANATRAAEVIQETSRMITILAPRRYPTLPEGRNAFIVGEERAPLNATVISTVRYENTEVVVNGNVSQFITVSPSTFLTRVGYTFFTIGLTIPDNLPLSAAGRYLGNLTLVTDSNVIATMELDLAITTFGGRVLIDMSHHSLDDPDDPSYYSYFKDYLRARGIVSSWLGDPQNPVLATDSTLGDADAFLVMDTEVPYAPEEIDAIHQFVEDGGVLIVLSEYYDSETGQASFAIDSYNELLQPYGIQCERYTTGYVPFSDSGIAYGVGYGGVVDNSSPLMDDVERLYILMGSALTVDENNSNARGLFWTDSTKRHALVATATEGKGQVLVIADGSTLYDTTIYDAIRSGADNLKFLENVASWINPVRPRVYDVILEAGEIGETANLTAYIFDDDLEDVRITVTTPLGELVNTTMTETLGYRYHVNFTMASAGFYDVTIVARDSAGNVRTFTKTILVPVEPVDESFARNVMIALLAVAGLALCYVAVIKFGVRRPRVRRRSEDEEWEIPIAPPGQGAPPEIE